MPDSTQATLDHINKVQVRIAQIQAALEERAAVHDRSKLQEPEKSGYDLLGQSLHSVTYGTPEYYAVMNDPLIKSAIRHHVENNSHHPEAHEGGVGGMSLLDLVEMFCDWQAASERGGGVSFSEGLAINVKRFGIDDQLYNILVNTVRELGW